MQLLSRAALPAVALALLSISPVLLAQRPLCNQLPMQERDRARAAGSCRELAPIIDVVPRPPDSTTLPPVNPDSASLLTVPHVVGQSFDDARHRLARFTLQRTYRAAAEPGGTVLAQSPMAPATVPAGAPVTLVLSDGSLVKVPNVMQLNINDARQRLQKDVDLKAQPVVVTSEQRVGTVIGQEPSDGTLVKRGGIVRLQVSAGQEGPELIDVPNVVGMSFDRAKARLVRFVVERTDRPRTDRASPPEGQVVEQSLRPAVRAPAGSVIVLGVASAPRATIEIFEMPNVIGRAYADALRSLAEFKVSRNEVDSAEPRGRIVGQTPTAGSTLLPGDAVTLQVSANSVAAAASATTTTDVDTGKRSAPQEAVPASKANGGREVLTGMLAIAAAMGVGLIVGALVMRQWLSRQRAVAAADNAITQMSPAPPPMIASVDILLEEERVLPEGPGPAPVPEPPADELHAKETGSSDESEKHQGP